MLRCNGVGGEDAMTTELVNLLNRAAAALETPDDLTEEEKAYLIEDLVVMAAHLEGGSSNAD